MRYQSDPMDRQGENDVLCARETSRVVLLTATYAGEGFRHGSGPFVCCVMIFAVRGINEDMFGTALNVTSNISWIKPLSNQRARSRDASILSLQSV